MLTKIGHVTFEHHEEYRGEVEIRRGDVTVKVPMEALRTLVAESIRSDMTQQIQKLKPSDLLRRIA